MADNLAQKNTHTFCFMSHKFIKIIQKKNHNSPLQKLNLFFKEISVFIRMSGFGQKDNKIENYALILQNLLCII